MPGPRASPVAGSPENHGGSAWFNSSSWARPVPGARGQARTRISLSGGRAASVQRVAPTKPLETTEPPVGRHPVVTGLDGEGGIIGIGDKIPLGADFPA